MPQDVPDFMQTMVEQDAGNDPLSPLREDILKDPDLAQDANAKPEETTTEKADESADAKQQTPTETDNAPKDEKQVEEKPGEEKKPDETKTEEKPGEKKQEVDKAAIVEKTADKIADTVSGRAVNEELKKAIALAGKTPLINIKTILPNVADFQKEDGTFDVHSYMTRAVTNLVMEFQKSLIAGPLSATLYGVLSTSMSEDQQVARVEAEATQKAQTIYDSLVKNFPRLKTDKDFEETFDSLVRGENAKRLALAEQMKKEGKELPPMTYEDFEKLLLRIVGKSQTPGTDQTPDPTDSLKPGITMNGNGVSTDEVDPDIAGMMRVKTKDLFS